MIIVLHQRMKPSHIYRQSQKTPLLEAHQEKAHFERYQEGIQNFNTSFKRLPTWIIKSLEIPAKKP